MTRKKQKENMKEREKLRMNKSKFSLSKKLMRERSMMTMMIMMMKNYKKSSQKESIWRARESMTKNLMRLKTNPIRNN